MTTNDLIKRLMGWIKGVPSCQRIEEKEKCKDRAWRGRGRIEKDYAKVRPTE
jgi:hypothetical protein